MYSGQKDLQKTNNNNNNNNKKQSKKQNKPSVFRIFSKLSQRAIHLTEKIVFVIDHVRVIVLMVFTVKKKLYDPV